MLQHCAELVAFITLLAPALYQPIPVPFNHHNP
jgi:hypothetical protein